MPANVEEIFGNIFDSECRVLVNTVNCIGFMGKGIALEYKYRFPGLFDAYKQKCSSRELRIGTLFDYHDRTSGKIILNFPTKNDWKHPSRIEYLDAGLQEFCIYVNDGRFGNKPSIAFPILGGQAGGLDPDKVIIKMNEYFQTLDENVIIQIYRFDRSAKDELFNKFYEKIKEWDVDEYVSYIGIKKQQANKIHNNIHDKDGYISNMFGIQMISGIGEETIKKIYEFAKKDDSEIPYQEKFF